MSGPAETGNAHPADKPAPPYRPLFAVAAVLLGPFIVSFHSRFFAIGLADIKGALSLSFDEGAWLSTAGTASQIMIAPAVAWLASTIGIRRLFVAPTLLYTIVSVAIPFVRSYDLLLALHIVHGLCLGVFVPATMMVILRSLPPQMVAASHGALCVSAGIHGECRDLAGRRVCADPRLAMGLLGRCAARSPDGPVRLSGRPFRADQLRSAAPGGLGRHAAVRRRTYFAVRRISIREIGSAGSPPARSWPFCAAARR